MRNHGSVLQERKRKKGEVEGFFFPLFVFPWPPPFDVKPVIIHKLQEDMNLLKKNITKERYNKDERSYKKKERVNAFKMDIPSIILVNNIEFS